MFFVTSLVHHVIDDLKTWMNLKNRKRRRKKEDIRGRESGERRGGRKCEEKNEREEK